MASFLLWNPGFFLLLYLTAGSHVTTASILLNLHGLEDSLVDSKDRDSLKTGGGGGGGKPIITEKRQTATGTCTCTCETKPSNSTSTSWTAETSGESNRKSAPEVLASGLRTDMSAGNRAHHGAAPVSGAKQPAKPKTGQQAEETDDNNRLTDIEIGDSSQLDWGHGSRFLWKRLPDRMCYREPCSTDNDCCLWYNICDRSAKVCVDCWYGSPCSSERDCCVRYPYCDGDSRTLESGGPGGLGPFVVGGQCVDELR